MPKLKTLSGREIIKILSQFGFKVVSQRGSHVKLRRVLSNGTKQTLTIPLLWINSSTTTRKIIDWNFERGRVEESLDSIPELAEEFQVLENFMKKRLEFKI